MNWNEWLGEENELGLSIANKKYRHGDETVEEFIHRACNGNEALMRLYREKKALLGGRTNANRGLDTGGSYMNCYSSGYVLDDYRDIMQVATNIGITFKGQGGQGVSMSKLRPKGSPIGKTYTSDGIIPFMKVFNEVTDATSQGGSRKGALMISLDARHAEALDFIHVKSGLGIIEKANLSLEIDDEFMEAVQKYYETGEVVTLHETRDYSGHLVKYDVVPIDIFKALVDNCYDWGDPAALFVNRFRNYNLMEFVDDYQIETCNPCVTGDTLVSTDEGEFQIRDLVGTRPFVYCMGDDGELTIRQASKVWMTRKNARIIEVETYRGNIRCTPDHLICTRNRGWVEAQDLRHGDMLVGLNRTMKDEIHVAVALSGGKYIPEHRFVLGSFEDIEGKDVHHKDEDTFNNRRSNLEALDHGEHSRISNTGRKIEVIRDDKGRYISKENKVRRKGINQGCNVGTNWFVKRVTWLEELEDVYDMTVPGVHNFVANRIVVHNCGEQPLPKHGACCLGSINLSEFVKNPYTEDAEFDLDDFCVAVNVMVEALDDIVEENYSRHPLKEQQETSYNYRNIGLGVFGYATMLMKMGMRYGGSDALMFTDYLFTLMFRTAVRASSKLAKERGCFPKYSEDVWNSEIIKKHFTPEEITQLKQHGLRNCSLLSVAPNGSIANLLGESGGCEPEYAISYTRRTVGMTDGEDTYYEVYCKAAREWREKYPGQELPDYFVASEDIPWQDRVATQATMQHHIDTAISSTVNLPEDATKEDIAGIYLEAWKQGCKGITIFRNNCKRLGILMTTPSKDTKNKSTDKVEVVTEASTGSEGHSDELARGEIIKASDKFVGKKRTLRTGCGTLHCEAFFDPDNGELREVYLSKGSSGGCLNFMVGLSRMISLAARGGIDIEDIVDQLKSCGTCPSYAVRRATHGDTSTGSSCPVAVGNALIAMHEEMIQQMNFGVNLKGISCREEDVIKPVTFNTVKCPECGGELVFEGGCNSCKQCGWSKCD